MNSHTCCIYLTFLRYVFSYVSCNGLPERTHNRTGHICLTFLHCVFSNVPSNVWYRRLHNHTGCICLIFLHCVFSNVSSNGLLDRMQNHTGCTCLTFLCHLSLSSHWLCFYLNLAFQDFDPFLEVCSQLICLGWDGICCWVLVSPPL